MLGVVSHTFNPNTWEVGRSDLEASLVFRVSSWTAMATQNNLVLENNNKNIKRNHLVWGGAAYFSWLCCELVVTSS